MKPITALALPFAFFSLATPSWAANIFPATGNVGIGTAAPAVLLDVYKALANGETAVQIKFDSNTASIATVGVRISGLPTSTGSQTGLIAGSSSSASSASNTGAAVGNLALTTSWNAYGSYVGVSGVGKAKKLVNFDATTTSSVLGGRFTGGADGTSPLNVLSPGSYLVGGVYGEVVGNILVVNNPASSKIVAGVIGVDKSTGYPGSLAGYFSGNVMIERDDNPFMTIGSRNVGGLQFGYARCTTCFSMLANDNDAVIRVQGNGKNLILSTANGANTGRKIIITNESSRLAVFSDSGDICLGTGC